MSDSMPQRRQRTVAFENVGTVTTNSLDELENRTLRIHIPHGNGDELMQSFSAAEPFNEHPLFSDLLKQFERCVTPTHPGLGRVNAFIPFEARDNECAVVGALSVGFQHTETATLQTDDTFTSAARRTVNKIRSSNSKRSNLGNSTFHDALPPGFPVPEPSEHNSGEIKRVSAKVQGKYVAKSRPVKALPGASVFRQKPASRACRVTTSAEIVDERSPGEVKSQSFQIKDAEKVELYLREKLILLQQQALKKIAKVWIKTICPKKQAKYPYSSSKQEDGEPTEVPPWWPSIELCRHIEPDHIKAYERVNLIIHLLRLRPSPQDLHDWNGTAAAHNTAHAFQVDGEWTQYLKRLTPLSLLDDIYREPQAKIDRRPLLLNELFQVAEMEEQYALDGNDGNDTVTWTPDPEALLKEDKKRSRRHSGLVDEDDEGCLTETSSLDSQPKAKKAKPNSRGKKVGRRKSTKGRTKAIDQRTPASHNRYAQAPRYGLVSLMLGHRHLDCTISNARP